MELTQDMTSLERYLIDEAAEKNVPSNGSIELSPVCNLNCDMCYVRLDQQKVKKLGNLRSVSEWIEIGKQMQKSGVLFLLLTGGEPLLYPDFKELFIQLKSMGMILTVNTNGTLIDENWAEFFNQYRPRRVNVTLYGADNSTYERLCHYPEGYDRALNGIRLLQKYDIPVKISSSATKANQQDLNKILNIGQKLGIPTTIDAYMLPATRERSRKFNFDIRLSPEEAAKESVSGDRAALGEKSFTEYRNRMLWEVEHILPAEGVNRMNCLAGKASFAINWQGNMRPCVVMSEPSMSVFDHGFQTAWEYIVSETRKIVLCSKCNSCNLRPVCRICAACALLEGGSFEAVPEYMCRYAAETKRQLVQSLE